MPYRLADADTREQIAALRLSGRPLLVLDVDEVVLEFVDPFMEFLQSKGFRLQPRSFSLSGNVVAMDHGRPIADADVSALVGEFFHAQESWQKPVAGAIDGIARLQADCEIVLLTAMPARHAEARRSLLTRSGLAVPLITASDPKGLVLKVMCGEARAPLAFVDDIHVNLSSVAEHLPQATVVHFMANSILEAHLPPLPPSVEKAASWDEIEAIVGRAFAAGRAP